MKKMYSLLLLLLCTPLCFAQLPCNIFPRERIASCFHGSIMLTLEDSIQYWGEFANPDTDDTAYTGRSVLAPQTLAPIYYSGTPLAVAAGANDQFFFLTTAGLYGWGMHYNILSPIGSSLFANIQAVPLPESDLTGTVDLDAADIATIESSSGGIALVTKIDNPGRTNGEVYIKDNMPTYYGHWLYGDGTEIASDAEWHKVTLATDSSDMNHVVRVSITYSGAMALTDVGKVYAWGHGVFAGDGSPEVYQSRALEVLLPQEAGDDITPKDINIVYRAPSHAQFILGTNGKLYAAGNSAWGILGIDTTDAYYELLWRTVRGPEGGDSELKGIIQISSSNSFSLAGIGALDSAGRLYLWGYNDFNMLEGDSAVYYRPHLATSLISDTDTSRIVYFEMGGHTTIAFRDSTYKMCYVGHKVAGSMGDGTDMASTEAIFNCEDTPEIPLCPPPQTVDTTGTDTTDTTKLILPQGIQNDLIVYPNPVEDRLVISGLKGGELIRITDITGKILINGTNGHKSRIVMPFNSLGKGMYIVHIIDRLGDQTTFKIRKQSE